MRYGLLIDTYLLGPEILRRAVTGMSDEQLDVAPIPGKWSTREVVMHLADFDLLYADHMKRVIAEDQPTLVDGDAELFAARLAYDKRDVDREIWMIKALRLHMAPILRNIDADDFVRIGMHQNDGPLTLCELLERVTDHIPHHVRSIEEKRWALDIGGIEMPLHMAAIGVR
jgi:hypothetical protein